MGAGIAQLACAAGLQTRLFDADPGALSRGHDALMRGLRTLERKGRLDDAGAAIDRLGTVEELESLAPCELVVEAAPESRELKRELFARLSAVCGPDTVLATNTSSIPITALAGAAAHPENVVGMHFFNPPPLMELVEVIAAEQTGERALALARATGEAMGRRVIDAADGPGFLVNRCARPFQGEALRIVAERVAGPAEVDRICRLGAGFRMGPFELMDLVGIDVGYAVARSFSELSFGEPRWRPSPLQARMVDAGTLGRKTGRGWYRYPAEGPYREEDPPAPTGEGLDFATEAPRHGLVSCERTTLAAAGGRDAVGFSLLPGAGLVELVRGPEVSDQRCAAAEELAARAGLHHAWVGDAPALVLARIVCCLVNEAAFAVGEGVGAPADVDRGLELGLNHPRGPVAWGETLGLDRVLGVLDGLWAERREERYRAAPLLRRAVDLSTTLAEAA
jgi:3-hydroxybutyryl-CoA dehydrogenase